MEDDLIDVAVEKLIASADGDARRAMRALLIEAFRLQAILERLVGGSGQADASPKKHMN